MFKRFLIAAALVIASPAIVSAQQDIFWSFESASSKIATFAPLGSVGTAYIFSNQSFSFDALDLAFQTSDPNVLLLTGGTAINPTFNVIGATAFDSSIVTVDAAGADGNLFSVNVTQNGIRQPVSETFNPAWEAGVGSAGAVRIAAVDYAVVGEGNATLSFSLGTQGALDIFGMPSFVELDPSFGSAVLTTGIPEPASFALWVLGSVGLVARRKRS